MFSYTLRTPKYKLQTPSKVITLLSCSATHYEHLNTHYKHPAKSSHCCGVQATHYEHPNTHYEHPHYKCPNTHDKCPNTHNKPPHYEHIIHTQVHTIDTQIHITNTQIHTTNTQIHITHYEHPNMLLWRGDSFCTYRRSVWRELVGGGGWGWSGDREMGVWRGHTGNMNKSCITRVTWGENGTHHKEVWNLNPPFNQHLLFFLGESLCRSDTISLSDFSFYECHDLSLHSGLKYFSGQLFMKNSCVVLGIRNLFAEYFCKTKII